MNYNDKLIEEIKKQFTKQINTLYQVRIVFQRYSKRINVFFEYSKIGTARHSEQIGKYDEQDKNRMLEFADRVKKETNLTVELINFD